MLCFELDAAFDIIGERTQADAWKFIPAYPVVTLSHLAWLVISVSTRSKCDNRIGRIHSMSGY
jgi:hypothetical protein